MTIRSAIIFLAVGLAGSLSAQTLANLGLTAPTPGANDISQLSTSGNKTAPDGINYLHRQQPAGGADVHHRSECDAAHVRRHQNGGLELRTIFSTILS